jgi:hypothetical protein
MGMRAHSIAQPDAPIQGLRRVRCWAGQASGHAAGRIIKVDRAGSEAGPIPTSFAIIAQAPNVRTAAATVRDWADAHARRREMTGEYLSRRHMRAPTQTRTWGLSAGKMSVI